MLGLPFLEGLIMSRRIHNACLAIVTCFSLSRLNCVSDALTRHCIPVPTKWHWRDSDYMYGRPNPLVINAFLKPCFFLELPGRVEGRLSPFVKRPNFFRLISSCSEGLQLFSEIYFFIIGMNNEKKIGLRNSKKYIGVKGDIQFYS